MVTYVVGFMFAVDHHGVAHHVALLRKARPDWQAGKLNGVGGEVEPGETIDDAMRREGFEETGLALDVWNRFMRLSVPGEAEVHFYRAALPMEYLVALDGHCREGESIEVWPLLAALERRDLLQNLRWILRIGADASILFADVEERVGVPVVDGPES